jgi:hypothetical protein
MLLMRERWKEMTNVFSEFHTPGLRETFLEESVGASELTLFLVLVIFVSACRSRSHGQVRLNNWFPLLTSVTLALNKIILSNNCPGLTTLRSAVSSVKSSHQRTVSPIVQFSLQDAKYSSKGLYLNVFALLGFLRMLSFRSLSGSTEADSLLGTLLRLMLLHSFPAPFS